MTIRRKFAKLPRILILHLKRYQFQESDSEFKLVKNDSSLKIPQYLKLSSLTTTETKPITPVSIIQKAAQKMSIRPILRSINSKMNITPGFKIPKMDKVAKDSEDELPDLDVTDRFKDYRLNNLTEQQQIEQALLESQLLTSIDSVVDTIKSKVDLDTMYSNSMLYLDGTSYAEEFQEEDSNDQDYHPRKDKLKTYENRNRKPLFSLNAAQNNDFDQLNKKNFFSKKKKVNKSEVFDLNKDEEDNDLKRAIQASLGDLKQEITYQSDMIEDPFDAYEPTKDIKTKPESKRQTTIQAKKPIVNEAKKITKNVTFLFFFEIIIIFFIILISKIGIKYDDSYRIIGIVNHLGVSSNSGHYISDVYSLKTKQWSSYDDSKVETISEEEVLTKRSNTGYIFFYIHK